MTRQILVYLAKTFALAAVLGFVLGFVTEIIRKTFSSQN